MAANLPALHPCAVNLATDASTFANVMLTTHASFLI
jgi:hypothetical protein